MITNDSSFWIFSIIIYYILLHLGNPVWKQKKLSSVSIQVLHPSTDVVYRAVASVTTEVALSTQRIYLFASLAFTTRCSYCWPTLTAAFDWKLYFSVVRLLLGTSLKKEIHMQWNFRQADWENPWFITQASCLCDCTLTFLPASELTGSLGGLWHCQHDDA